MEIEPNSARDIKSFIEQLRKCKNCNCIIAGRMYRYRFSKDPLSCDVTVDSFPVAKIWNNKIEFSLPTPHKDYFRLFINKRSVGYTIQWTPQYHVIITTTSIDKQVKVGITKNAKVECYMGNRLLAQFTHYLSTQSVAIRKTLQNNLHCDVRLQDKNTGVEVVFRYVQYDFALDNFKIIFPLDFVKDNIGTLRVALLLQEQQQIQLQYSHDIFASEAERNDLFNNVSSDIYMSDDWEFYKTTINALTSQCSVIPIEEQYEIDANEKEKEIALNSQSLEISSIVNPNKKITYYKVTETEDSKNYELTECTEPQKRIIWICKLRNGMETKKPFLRNQIFRTVVGIWHENICKTINDNVINVDTEKLTQNDREEFHNYYNNEENIEGKKRLCMFCS